MSSMINFDANATAPLAREAVDAMCAYALKVSGNPSSAHPLGTRTHAFLDAVRREIVHLVGGEDGDRLIITSGATEANNIALLGTVLAWDATGAKGMVVTSELEHPSVSNCVGLIERSGKHTVVRAAVTPEGTLDVGSLRKILNDVRIYMEDVPILVSMMTVNHELGTVQPVAEVRALCSEFGAMFHSDATQAIGKLALPKPLPDYVTFSAHKFNGPTGVGGLLIRAIAPPPHQIMRGGDQQWKMRPGTENVIGAVGMVAALRKNIGMMDRIRPSELALRLKIVQCVFPAVGAVRTRVNGGGGPRGVRVLPTTVSVTFFGQNAEAIVAELGKRGICVSVGSACKANDSKGSNVLRATGMPEAEVKATVRISFGWHTTADDVRRLCEAIHSVFRV